MLTKEVYISIIEKSVINAQELYNEGELLFKNGYFARAYSLFQFSIEETGKALLSFATLINHDYTNIEVQEKFLKDFRDHKIKSKIAIRMDIMAAKFFEKSEADNGISKILVSNALTQLKNLSKLNDLKNSSLYTDIENDKVINPSDLINKEIADNWKFYCFIRNEQVRQTMEVSLKNIDNIIDIAKGYDREEFEKEMTQFIEKNSTTESKKYLGED